MQNESVFAFMHVACVHIYLREHLCVCVTVRMRDAHKMPSENKSLSPTPAAPSTPSLPLPISTQANNSFMYPAALALLS